MRPVILVFLFLAGCTAPISEADLTGLYSVSFGGEHATLILRADHTYTHVVKTTGGQTIDNKGTWRALHDRSPIVVAFEDFNPISGFGKGRAGQWLPPTERTWTGRVQLCFDPDFGYCYIKD